MCLMPMSERILRILCGWSFTNGIIGSIRTETGLPALIRSCAALKRWEGEGAKGSRILARSSSSVVMVNATVDGTLTSKSSSRVTMLLLVMICILQLFSTKISRQRLVKPSVASALGYGSEELEIEMVSPLSLAASLFNIVNASFLGWQSLKFGM